MTMSHDKISLQPAEWFFYRYCLYISQDIVNGMELTSGQAIYIEHDDNSTYSSPMPR